LLVLGLLRPQFLSFALIQFFASLVNGAKAESGLIRRILDDKRGQLVGVVQLTGPTASVATALDDALLDVHVHLRKVTLLAAHVLLDELVQR